MKTATRLLILIVFGIFSFSIMADPGKIPVKTFFGNATYSGLQLSPNGEYLAVMSPVNGHRNIVFMKTDTLKNPQALTGLSDQDVAGFFWANDEDIVFTMDSDGNEAFGLYTVSINGKPKIKTLIGSWAGASGIRSASVVSRLPEDPAHIIVQFNGRRVQAPDLYLLPIDSSWNEKRKKNAGMKIIAKNPGDIQGWIVDHDGEVRAAVSLNGVRGQFHYKDKGEKDFRVIREYNIFDEEISPLGFAFDNKTMYVASNIGRDRNAIYTYDPTTNELGDMIYGHDEVDVGGVQLSRVEKKLVAIQYFDDYPHVVYFDKATNIQMEGLAAAFPGKQVNIASQTDDEKTQIILVSDDQDPGAYYLYDKDSGSARYLLTIRPSIDPDEMSEMKPIRFTSRDGLTIRGYLTIPKSSDGKNLPLIINPHGGPFGVRDFWGYNPEHQFFASRGYATVQVNFRGSGGYGLEFQKAGFGGKWGAEMQNDLTDAVKYLIDQGIADPDRVCIYGASYGGYATMAGLAFTPELYKCGINYVGVTDVRLLFTSMPRHWEPLKGAMKVQIGDPDDKALMKRMSPLAHVENIKAPLMIIQGARDPRVVKQHATDLRKALRKQGVKLSSDEWIMKKDEGHGFRKENNRLELYEKMEKFLAKNL